PPRNRHTSPTRRSSDLDVAGKIDAERHRDHVRAFVDGPLDGLDDGVAATAVAAEHLADERPGDARRHADARAVDAAAEDRAGAIDRKSTRLNSSHVNIS